MVENMRLPDKKILLPIVALLLFISYVSYITIQSPLVGFSVKEEGGKWIVDEVFENGWAYNQNIHVDDIIVEIDGEYSGENREIIKTQLIRTAKSLTLLDGNGQEKHYIVSYQTEIGQLVSHFFLPIAYTILTIYVSLYLYRKQKHDVSVIVLIQFLLCIALAYGSAGASSRGDLIARFVNAVTFTGCLVLYIRFLNIFLKRFQVSFIKESHLWKLYMLIVLILVENVVLFFIPALSNIQTITELGVFSLLLIVIITLLIKNYSKYMNQPGSQAIKLLVLIFALAFSPFTLLYAVPSILFNQYFLNAEIAVIFLLLIPIGFIYLQLAEKLFDIDYIIGRLKYYTMLAFPFSVLLAGGINLILNNDLFSIPFGTTLIWTFVSSILFLYWKEWIDYKSRKYLFSSKGDLQTNLYTFFHKTQEENKVQGIVARILSEMEENLEIQQAIFIQLEQDEETRNWRVHTASSEIFIDSMELEKVKWESQTIGTLIFFPKGFAVVIGSEVGMRQIILCDEKKSGTNLNVEEKIWIEMMAYFSSIVLENMKLIEGLVVQISNLKLQETNQHPTWLSRLLFTISEKERASLSNDLHDSILQEQLQLLREIEDLERMADSTTLKDKLNVIKEQMLDNVHLIRETCMELRPPLLNEQGLMESLYQLIRQTKLRSSFLLHTSLDEKIKMNKEKELILYRIVQELFNNAMKHSNARSVNLKLYQSDESIHLIYEDDGDGFEINDEGYSFSSMGLVGIKERIRSIQGDIDIVSSLGQGLKVTIDVGMEGDLK